MTTSTTLAIVPKKRLLVHHPLVRPIPNQDNMNLTITENNETTTNTTGNTNNERMNFRITVAGLLPEADVVVNVVKEEEDAEEE